MLTDEFQHALEALVEIASEARTTIMCAEAVPQKCHRQLIADALVALRKILVVHILTEGLKEHDLNHFARIKDGRLVYPKPQGSLFG